MNVTLGQFSVKSLLERICIVSTKGTFVKNADPSYNKISCSLNLIALISSANWNTSVLVYLLTESGFSFSSSYFART